MLDTLTRKQQFEFIVESMLQDFMMFFTLTNLFESHNNLIATIRNNFNQKSGQNNFIEKSKQEWKQDCQEIIDLYNKKLRSLENKWKRINKEYSDISSIEKKKIISEKIEEVKKELEKEVNTFSTKMERLLERGKFFGFDSSDELYKSIEKFKNFSSESFVRL